MPVPPGGYSWWYIDALSDDKQHGLTIIAFIGSVFSPYYAWSGWRDPENYCAMNVALYRAGRDRWTMTERGRGDLSRSHSSIAIGPSSMHWDGDALKLEIDEWTAPLPSRVRGTVTLRPEAINTQSFALDAGERHHWRPIAPRARVDVRFDGGALDWSGDAYFDSNWGEEPLERGFRSWHWSRAHTHNGTQIYYDVTPRSGADRSLALHFDQAGSATEIDPPQHAQLPNTFWRVPRATRGPAGAAPRLVRTLEDAPFYARSQLIGEINGAPADIMHESLSLDRFRMPIVRAMLPFRMPRIVGRR
ncbi:hydratase [Terricaulis sp.]|uniref:hydratase n=1 Tax=Terricaulis sp. TaxID=2768686 RepID=UPI002AC46BD6|nr:hydratase [Terricaulis sp.]MDZ4691540.1 hydratase [Terricaulis sp.]